MLKRLPLRCTKNMSHDYCRNKIRQRCQFKRLQSPQFMSDSYSCLYIIKNVLLQIPRYRSICYFIRKSLAWPSQSSPPTALICSYWFVFLVAEVVDISLDKCPEVRLHKFRLLSLLSLASDTAFII